ncbi:MAG: cytochrome c peroxidase [Pirellulaceae bacterium]
MAIQVKNASVADISEATASAATPVPREPAASEANSSNATTKPRRIIQAVARLRANARLIGCCLAAMFCGMLLTSIPGWIAQPEAEPTVEPPPVYVATTARRAEPISPIIPFDDLDPDVVELGRRLFHDPQLSGTGRISCASCHNASKGGADGLAIASGGNPRRHTPTIFNAALNIAQNWDGSAETLEEQLDHHFKSDGAMEADWPRVLKAVTLDPLYNRSFKLYLHSEPTEQLVRTAIATYERSLLTVDSKFDRWLQGKEQLLTSDETGGYYLFKQLGCISCHQGAGVGGSMFLVDRLKQPEQQTLEGLSRLRVPSLRNVALTSPYFHDGSVPTMEKAVERMMRERLDLEPNPVDVKRISAFLKSLTATPPSEFQ